MNCFEAHEKHRAQCNKKECRYWIDNDKSMNCTLIAAKGGPMTLQQIGDVFSVTRMRICQLEKKIVTKLNQVVKI